MLGETLSVWMDKAGPFALFTSGVVGRYTRVVEPPFTG
jgi:hypothetical protein